ncbi:solute carrier family 23 member 1-like isoform X2 [Liolophura sinensis]|uniref:solute carrier family 23 member 1-like isoform X2 n=1 Tax=Liolophura sinensis TaxID=3198878 RepID=UPI0031582DF5
MPQGSINLTPIESTGSERKQQSQATQGVDKVNLSELNGGDEGSTSDLLYGVEDIPPVPVTIVFAIQVAVINVSFCVTMAVLIAGVLCADAETKTKLTSTTLLMAGIATILQTTFGVRLPIFQGPNAVFLVPILNMANFPEWQCPSNATLGTGYFNESGLSGVDGVEILSTSTRIQRFEGSLLVASAVHITLGASGLVGYVSHFIGPLTVAPTIALIGVVIIDSAIDLSSTHWGISIFTMLVVVLMTSYLEHVKVPLPAWTRDKGCHVSPYPVFHVYALCGAVLLGWLLSLLLTVTGMLTDNKDSPQFRARTDARLDAISSANWFYFPYPGRFGGPSFSLNIFVGMVLCVFMSIIESVGDYITASRICGVPMPPTHAINRGLLVEGICSLISGVLGASHATTSYSGMISVIGLTKVGSRLVFQLGGFCVILLAIVGKFSAVFVSIPDPVFGGLTIASIATLTGVGIASLNTVNLSLSRNYVTLGFSLILGILLPRWVQDHPSDIDTGSVEVDRFLVALIGNSPFVGGFVGFFLDLTLPGKRSTFQDIHQEKTQKESIVSSEKFAVYNLPWLPSRWFAGKWARFVPIVPSFYDNEIYPIQQIE